LPKLYRQIFLQLQSEGIRTATFDDREHLVVPVIALVEGVIHAVNAPEPELVLADEISQAPQGWNGRPVVAGHPIRNNEPVSANDPRVLESEGFGTLFNTHMDGTQLKTEAWLDPLRAQKVGKKAEEIIQRVQNGELIEISVGAFITSEAVTGEHKGEKFSAIWREIVPDHLAMLKEGSIGACSVEMGCGAPRMAHMYTLSAKGYTSIKAATECKCNKEEKVEPKTLYEKYKEGLKTLHGKAVALFRMGEDDDSMSDNDLRDMLNTELQKTEPGFLGVEAVFMDSSKVVFAVAPEDRLQFFRRGFSVSDGNVTLEKGSEEVTMVTRFEPLAQSPAVQPKQGEEDMDEALKARIQALIDSDKNSFVAADLEYLGTFDEERLSQLEAQATVEPVKEPPVVVPPAVVPPAVVPPVVADPLAPPAGAKTDEELEAAFLESAPQGIKDMVSRSKAEEKSRRDSLIAILKTAQKSFTETELNMMTTPVLQKMVVVAGAHVVDSASKIVDYSGQGLVRPTDDKIPAAKSVATRIAERKAAGL